MAKPYLTLILTLLALCRPLLAQEALPPCGQRPTQVDKPFVDGRFYCIERVIMDVSLPPAAFTAMVAVPDGTLYATRPYSGQIIALHDSDGDGLPDSPQIFAEGLHLPNALAYHDGALYISGGRYLYRLSLDGALEVLADDLPVPDGLFAGGVAVDANGDIYVGVGAPCDYCQPQAEQGAILRVSADSSAREVVASGLHFPADLTFLNGTLWILDDSPDDWPDEVNRFTEGADYGWPRCFGRESAPRADGDCAGVTPPAWTFSPHSRPQGLAAYSDGPLPLAQTLLVALGGSYHRLQLEGYRFAALDITGGAITRERTITPDDGPGNWMNEGNRIQLYYILTGFWPYRPYDVTISPQGWLYLSADGGRIFALRP